MAERVKKTVKVMSNECLTPGIYSMWIEDKDMASMAKPGQFVSLYTNDGTKLLPRPISICDKSDNGLRLVYRVSGEGTKQFSKLNAGDSIDVLGPLGNGYDIEAIGNECGDSLVVVGGGIGIPPMLLLAKKFKESFPEKKVTAVLGYRDKNTFLTKEFEETAMVMYASDNGDIGIKGNVIDAIKAFNVNAGTICACGPTPMLRGLIAYTSENNIPTYISLEEKMACGIGACLACVCKTKEVDDHSHVHNKRICADGPVFKAGDIEL